MSEPVAEVVECPTMGQQTVREIDGRWKFLPIGTLLYAELTVTDEMVNRFLGWKLPDDFSPDAGITFKRTYNEASPYGPSTHEPIGTNLLTATQARAMLEHVLGAKAGEPKCVVEKV